MDEQANKNTVANRVCLKCSQKFLSKGPGNRICRKCARINAGYGSVTEAMLAKQRGSKRHNGFIIGDTADILPD